jgi:hypothetical protein
LKGFGKTRQSRSWSSRSPVELLGKSWREMLTVLTQRSWILVWHWLKPRMPTSWNLIGIISPLQRTRRPFWRQNQEPNDWGAGISTNTQDWPEEGGHHNSFLREGYIWGGEFSYSVK